jgi:L-malate glycosyltransferase
LKLLYAYRYGIVGGVSTQLLLRQQALVRHGHGHGCDLFFSQDNGLRAVLPSLHGVHFGTDCEYRALIKRGAYDLVVVIDTPELLAHSRGGWWRQFPAVWLDVHTTTANGLAYLAQLNHRNLAGVMVPTRYSASLVSERVPGVVPQVLPNILNESVFSLETAASEPQWTDGTRHYIWVGKLDGHKNWRLALVYARLLKDILGPIQLTMVGGYTAPAATGQALFELARRLDLLDSICWVDRIDNRSLAGLYHRCRISGGAMLVTSRDESFGMAAAEALLCGCPLITNDLPVFREVFLDSEMIRRVDIWQPDQFQQAAEALAQGVELQVRQQMHDYLRSTYGPDAFMNALSTALAAQ